MNIPVSDNGSVTRHAILEKAQATFDPNRPQVPPNLFDELMAQYHDTPGDEKEKLREKDQALVNLIALYRNFLFGLGYLPRDTAVLFSTIADLFVMVENILWELKGEKGASPRPNLPDGGVVGNIRRY